MESTARTTGLEADDAAFRAGATRAWVLLASMAAVGLLAIVVSLTLLYRAASDEQLERIRELVRTQAQLVDAVARFDAVQSRDAHPAGAWAATLEQVADAHRDFLRGRDDISLLVIGEREGKVVVLVEDGRLLAERPGRLPPGFPPSLARRALSGDRGPARYEAEDGKTWLVEHDRIPTLSMAVVVRLDADVVRGPLETAAWVSGIASLFVVFLGWAFLRGTSVRIVTDLRNELGRTKEELVKRERFAVLGQITAKVSHELRNPLATLRASLFTLKERVQSGDAVFEQALERSERNVIRCDRIIEELLAYTRPRKERHETVDASELLSEIADEYPRARTVALDRRLAPGIELVVDREDLRRMVVNLLNNAADASEAKGGASPSVTLEIRSDSDGVTITIGDSGVGMAPDVLSRVFEPLFSTKGFGVGLGLSIVRELAARNGGSIGLESVEGSGTLARLRFPAARSSAAASPATRHENV